MRVLGSSVFYQLNICCNPVQEEPLIRECCQQIADKQKLGIRAATLAASEPAIINNNEPNLIFMTDGSDSLMRDEPSCSSRRGGYAIVYKDFELGGDPSKYIGQG